MKPDNTAIVCFGEALADCFPEQMLIGGAPLNVARHLAQLGCKAHIMTGLGNDELGDQIMALCQKENVLTDTVSRTSRAPTGQVQVSALPDGGHEFHIETHSAWDYIEASDRVREIVRQTGCLVYGTLALRKPANRQVLLNLISGYEGLVVCDFNWREGHIDLADAIELAKHCQWLKLNETELDMLLKHFGLKEVKDIVQIFRLSHCLITRGEQGYEVHDSQGKALDGASYSVSAFADSVGAGDSFLACTLAGYLQGTGLKVALDVAAQLAAGICSVRGAVPADSQFYTPYIAQILAARNGN